jgi:signal transduction histidine kinase
MSSILIVDDEPSSRETLLAMLDGREYRVETAPNGARGIQLAEELHPDLILLDVMMPEMDGFEVCRRLRSIPALAEIPILILTALDDRASLIAGLNAGADDFLTKPVDRQELRARVQTIVRLNRYHTLMQQRESLRLMAERVITAQEEERRRLSRELHDDLGQALTTQLLYIRNLQEDLTLPPQDLFNRLQSIYHQTFEVSVKIRSLAQDMRPPMLDALGLKNAMNGYCAEFSRRTGLPIHFEWDESLPPMPDLFSITLYRTLQEALTNIVKHARARQAWVELALDDRSVCLSIQDDGKGFAPKTENAEGIGLAGLRERMTLAGGVLTLSSNPTRGSILTARLPLPEEEKG